MTTPQMLSFALIVATIAMFAWGRYRYDTISLTALLIGVTIGVVPAKQAFTGFTSEVVIIIASALVISAAIARSGIVELAIAPLLRRLTTLTLQVPAMAGATALLSMLTKNVGALSILMPTAIKLGRSENSSASALLMPMSFISLIAGLVTLVGTSTNIIVSDVRERELGQPFRMFDFAPVGLSLTAIGLVFVTFGWRLLPRERTGREELGEANADRPYSTEASVPEDFPDGYATVADLGLDAGGVALIAIVSPDGTRRTAQADRRLNVGDVLLLEGDDDALATLYARVPLKPARADTAVTTDQANEEVRAIEAVVQPDSPLIGDSARRARLQERYGVKLLGVGRRSARVTQRLREIRIRAGDVLILQAGATALPEFLRSHALLPLAERSVALGNPRKRFGPAVILLAAIALVALGIAPVAIAFFGAAVLVLVVGALPIREAYQSLEPEVLILIGALTPISEAIQHNGGAAVIATHLAQLLSGLSPILVLGALLVAAMGCAPFFHNAPTVLVLGPIALMVAKSLHLNPDPFLMAVATGAGCDFLTPVGHQCNLLVMGPGGYRFSDYPRLGAPLSLLVILSGTPLIAWYWPLTG